MAKKAKQTFDLKALTEKMDNIVIDSINALGRHLNKAIQDNIKKGVDINDDPFEELKPITIALGGKQPLNRTGKMMKAISKTPATKAKPRFTLEITSKYGALHHTGYTTSPESLLPNKKVPARKWFGIPESFQPGGDEFEKMKLNVFLQVKNAWKKK